MKFTKTAPPEYKVLYDVLKLISNAYYNTKYKQMSEEVLLLSLAEAKGMLKPLVFMELNKTKKGE